MATKRKPPNRATFTVEVELFGFSTEEQIENYWIHTWEFEIKKALTKLNYVVKSIKTTISRKPVR